MATEHPSNSLFGQRLLMVIIAFLGWGGLAIVYVSRDHQRVDDDHAELQDIQKSGSIPVQGLEKDIANLRERAMIAVTLAEETRTRQGEVIARLAAIETALAGLRRDVDRLDLVEIEDMKQWAEIVQRMSQMERAVADAGVRVDHLREDTMARFRDDRTELLNRTKERAAPNQKE